MQYFKIEQRKYISAPKNIAVFVFGEFSV